MKFKALFLLLVAFFLAQNSHAEFRRGNGGNVLVCTENEKLSYELLDVFEAKNRFGFPLKFEEQGNETERARKIIERLRELNPTRYRLYMNWLETFYQDARFLTGMKIIGDIDVGTTYIPENCIIKQMIIQAEPLSTAESFYTIDLTVWNSLDVNNRVASIIHEFIYREALLIENQHNSSEPSRMLNGLLHSPQLQKMTLRDWLEFNQKLGFHQADAHGVPVRLNNILGGISTERPASKLTFYDHNHLEFAHIPYRFELIRGIQTFRHHCEETLKIDETNLYSIRFSREGRLIDLQSFPSPKCVGLEVLIFADGKRILDSAASEIKFNADGSLTSLDYVNKPTDQIKSLFISTEKISLFRSFISETGFRVSSSFHIDFKNNRPSFVECSVFNRSNSYTHVFDNGKWVQVPDATTIQLD